MVTKYFLQSRRARHTGPAFGLALAAAACSSIDVNSDIRRGDDSVQSATRPDSALHTEPASDVLEHKGPQNDDSNENRAAPEDDASEAMDRAPKCDDLMRRAASDSASTRSLEPVQQERFDDESFGLIWGSTESDIWALGERAAQNHADSAQAAFECAKDRFDATLVARHFDGSTWQLTDFPGSSHVNDLHGSSSDNIWAVGANAQAWHFDGSSWSSYDLSTAIDAPPGAAECDEVVLTSIWAHSDVDVWSVGYVRSAGEVSSLVLHFDGDKWTPQEVGGDEALLGVWAADGEHVWAVGARGVVQSLQVNGGWERVSSLTEHDLTSVCGASDNNVWVAGTAATMLRFDGAAWKTGTTSETASEYSTSHAMTARAGAGIWMLTGAVTQSGPQLGYVQTLDHWDGEGWCSVRASTDTTAMLAEVWVSPRGHVWAAGYGLVRFL